MGRDGLGSVQQESEQTQPFYGLAGELMKLSWIIGFGFLSMLIASTNAAETGVTETFGDGGVPSQNGWTVGNLGAVVADAGESGAGDHAISYDTDRGFHFLAPGANAGVVNSAFVGDYLAAGVTGIRFDARHSGAGDTVALRATAFSDFNAGVDWVASLDALEISPNATTWQTYEISLETTDLSAGGTNAMSVKDVLGAVVQIGLRHDPAGNGPQSAAFVSSATQVYFDDIVLVPEPCSGLLVILSGVCLGFVVRRQASRR